jgi:hypothetical protein
MEGAERWADDTPTVLDREAQHIWEVKHVHGDMGLHHEHYLLLLFTHNGFNKVVAKNETALLYP